MMCPSTNTRDIPMSNSHFVITRFWAADQEFPRKILDTQRSLEPLAVTFLTGEIDENGYLDSGMKAFLVDVRRDEQHGCFDLSFNMTQYSEWNKMLLKRVFYANKHTAKIDTHRSLFTAEEAGLYVLTVELMFGNISDDDIWEQELRKHIRVDGIVQPNVQLRNE